MSLPFLLVSDAEGNIFEVPELRMTGMSLNTPVIPETDDLIPLPYGSNLFMLSGRIPMGYDPGKKSFTPLEKYKGNPVFAVAAFMAPAYLQLLRAGYLTNKNAERLPMYSYTAAGWKDGQFMAAGLRIDPDPRQDLVHMNEDLIKSQAEAVLKKYPKNRLVAHLVNKCVKSYCCPAARNFVLERWECPAPTSPACNAECIACISRQPEESSVPASQDRIEFIPTPGEIAEFTVPHLEKAQRPVISFGQGCEGEPLLVGDVIEESIKLIRKKTDRGIININTNGSRPDVVKRLLEAGLDSIRVSLNSAQEKYYDKYYRPRQYGFEEIRESLKLVRRYNRWASLNYFMFPGFTDREGEKSALEKLILSTKINMIQTRNLNMDPEWYVDRLGLMNLQGNACGMRKWIDWIHESFPWIKLGYFNPPREEMKKSHFHQQF
ncbi:MAG: radical SAM protein [Spirochaetales bacterium]|nr:radical SAM protein [Spirochaetales bacterium]